MDTPERKGVYVSLQAPGYGYTALQAHRASGLILCHDRAVFPDLPESLILESDTYDLLLVPLPRTSDLPVERIRCRCMEVHKRLGDDSTNLLAAVFHLENATPLGLDPSAPLELADIRAGLEEEETDIWSVFDQMGLVRPEQRGDPEHILGPLGVVDRVGNVAKTSYHPATTSLACSICCWCCWCQCKCMEETTEE